MTREQIFALYDKERDYETCVFGNYSQVPSLNLASFIIFLDIYLSKVKSAYTGKWEKELPPWLLRCTEKDQDGNAPVKAYEEIIKIMALAGATLEAYTDIDPSKWREDFEAEMQKWKRED
jgi:hypothetical protein